ncbi:hypothetical protein TorRG33x02_339300 [Trema orientale]|uniref:Nucleoprotein TPR/MPL1 domain-containing protein n=1 Tax=Trema orientale TaxID=63057 RepID=A0A2P5AWN8_TREOI|nr:hypothetical protein TorRG33x02_339300 [Trema orientale]
MLIVYKGKVEVGEFEKELIERHNTWLNDELTTKAYSLIELQREHADREADLSSKLIDVERQLHECSTSLKWKRIEWET